MRHTATLASVLLFIAALANGPTSHAAPNNTKITAVYLTRNCSGTCNAGDPKLANQAIVTGTIQVDAASDDGLGFSSIRLEALGPGDPSYTCIRIWSPSGTHFADSTTWDTTHWTFPGASSGCTENVIHKHGEPTVNGSYSLRVVAVERNSNAQQASAPFTIRVANAAERPTWRGTPTANGNAVTVRWYRNTETDVIEYRINRTDSKGTKAISLSATDPTSTPGCEPEKEATFTCTDHPNAGKVSYTIQALRPTPASAPNCHTKSIACVASVPNGKLSVTVAGSSGGGATNTTPASSGPTTSAKPTASNSPTTLPSPTSSVTNATTSPGIAAPPPRDATTSRTAPIALAAAAALAIGAALVLRNRFVR